MNIQSLSRSGSSQSPPSVPPPRKRWMTRVLLPLGILVVIAGLLLYTGRDAIWPKTEVEVVRVVAHDMVPSDSTAASVNDPADANTVAVSQAGNMTATAAVSVQAPGWLEPDPYPTYVTALTNGIIEEVLVLEGERVEAGQIVARLVQDDAKLAVARAQAERDRLAAAHEAAKTDWDNPFALERAVSVAKAQLAEAVAEQAEIEARIMQETARFKELQTAYTRIKQLQPNAASQLEVEQAEYQKDGQEAMLHATKKQLDVVDARIQRHEAEVKAAEADLELRIDQKLAVAASAAALNEAQAALDEAQLRLSRMTVTSPVSGIVMARFAVPGAKVMLDMDSPHSAHIVHLYDPGKLQVRVDVPLADAAKVGVGQHARIVVDVLPNQEFTGRVTRFVHQADIGKNTVEVKVALDSPSKLLKPDMLARVKFLETASIAAGDGTTSGEGRTAGGLAVYAPASAIAGEGDEASVWLVSPGDNAVVNRKQVRLGSLRSDGWVHVTEGLQPGDTLVANPAQDLHDGQRVTIRPMAAPVARHTSSQVQTNDAASDRAKTTKINANNTESTNHGTH